MWVMMAASAGVMAQKEGFGYKFYGQVRTDLFYNSRSNSETVDGLGLLICFATVNDTGPL